jgi:preprotein translocase subunit SecG
MQMRLWGGVAIVAVGLCTSVFAQHGHAGGAGSSMGGGSGMGHGDSMGSSTSGMERGMSHSSTGSSMSQQSPDAALTKSPKLSSNLEKLLPSGITAQQACSGFKNLGQCVAAIHVSHNLGIPFTDLKSKMTGTGAESLGKAIQDLKPDANAKSEAKKANKQAEHDLNDSAS